MTHMENADIANKITKFITNSFASARRQKINEDTNLLENGVVDSMGVLELVTFLQDEFSLAVSDDQLSPENFQDVRSMVRFVQQNVQLQTGSIP